MFQMASPTYFPGFRALDMSLAPAAALDCSIKKIILQRDYEYRDGVRLHGEVTLEELEKVPGWHFAPSAAYLRSLVTEASE